MPRRESPLQSEMLQGTLDMLVLKTLVMGPAHGHTIAHAIEQRLGGRAAGRARLAVSGAPSARGPWLDRLLLGHLREQPQGELLPADACGPKQLATQTDAMGAGRARDRSHSASRRRRSHELAPFLPPCALGSRAGRRTQSYLDIETDDNIARGMSPDEARRAAHVKLGNTVAHSRGDLPHEHHRRARLAGARSPIRVSRHATESDVHRSPSY